MPSDDELVHRVRYAPEVFLGSILRIIDLPKVAQRFRLQAIEDLAWFARNYLAARYGALAPPADSADRILADTLGLLAVDLKRRTLREKLLCAAVSCTRMQQRFDDLMRRSMTASVLSLLDDTTPES